MKLHEFFSQIGITALLMLTKTFSVTEGISNLVTMIMEWCDHKNNIFI